MADRPPYVFLERVQDERLQVAQALVDACASPLLHDGFGGLDIEMKKVKLSMWH